MDAVEVRTFVLANLPPPPARVLEVGAGAGALARALRDRGYDVVAIDPEPSGEGVQAGALHELDEPAASFDAAVAIVSLHHVHPLAESLERLAGLLASGATLLVDEFDVAAFDRAAASWWLEQRGAAGDDVAAAADRIVDEHRAHLHPLREIVRALEPRFRVGPPVRGAYLYRWELGEGVRSAEEHAIAGGRIPAVGARLIAQPRR